MVSCTGRANTHSSDTRLVSRRSRFFPFNAPSRCSVFTEIKGGGTTPEQKSERERRISIKNRKDLIKEIRAPESRLPAPLVRQGFTGPSSHRILLRFVARCFLNFQLKIFPPFHARGVTLPFRPGWTSSSRSVLLQSPHPRNRKKSSLISSILSSRLVIIYCRARSVKS